MCYISIRRELKYIGGKKMNEIMLNKKAVLIAGIITLLIVLVVGIVWFLQMPINTFTIDVNPNIEIVTNRLDKVVEVNPLNEDAKKLLENYEIKNHEIQVVINDLVDEMILSGYILGGEDNVVMITVKDNAINESYVKKANEAIAAHLENKQIAYTILNQEIDDQEINTSEISDGKSALIGKILKKNDDLSFDVLAQMTLKELMVISEGIDPSSKGIFEKKLKSSDLKVEDDSKVIEISEAEASLLALEKTGGGQILNIKIDDGNYEIKVLHNDFVYELKLDGRSGEIRKFKFDASDDDGILEISKDQATTIALEKVGGGEVIKVEVDDSKYEIEILYSNKEYELEIHGRTGKILKYEMESDDDDDGVVDLSKDQASAIALEKVGGGEVIKVEVDDSKYEIEILYNDNKYELEIHGLTGEILKYEMESDDDDDEVLDLSKDQASAIALEKVGGGEVIKVEVDDSKYEIEILYNNKEYELEIHGRTGKILKYEMESDDDEDGVVDLSKDQATAIALEKVGGGEVIKVEVDDSKYEVEILYNNKEYELEIHGETGEILKYEMETDDDDDEALGLSKDQATAIALEKVGGGEVIKVEVDDSKYEIEILYNNKEYELEVHGLTGEILKYEMESDEDDDNEALEVSRDQATAIALEKVGGGEVIKVEVDDSKYEIEILYNNKEYELEIHGGTGEILKYEMESDD